MEIKNLPTSAEGAYPEVMITTKDRNTANILQNLYCDCNSETEAVLGYIYQYYITQPMEEDIAEIFEKKVLKHDGTQKTADEKEQNRIANNFNLSLFIYF